MTYIRPPNTVLAGTALRQNPPPDPLDPAGVLSVQLDADIASENNLGVVQVGQGLTITPEGVLSTIGEGIDYTAGPWTPQLTLTDGTASISVRNAQYVKIGQSVTCTFDFKITSISGDDDSKIKLIGLPFVSDAGSSSVGSMAVSYYQNFDKNVNYLSGTVDPSSNSVTVWYQQNPGQSLDKLIKDAVKVNTVLAGTVFYISNS